MCIVQLWYLVKAAEWYNNIPETTLVDENTEYNTVEEEKTDAEIEIPNGAKGFVENNRPRRVPTG